MVTEARKKQSQEFIAQHWTLSVADKVELSQYRKTSKLRTASADWLRHRYVTYLLGSGAPLKVAQENAGHHDIATTLHYRHLAQTDL